MANGPRVQHIVRHHSKFEFIERETYWCGLSKDFIIYHGDKKKMKQGKTKQGLFTDSDKVKSNKPCKGCIEKKAKVENVG